jgi:hypothetical protein
MNGDEVRAAVLACAERQFYVVKRMRGVRYRYPYPQSDDGHDDYSLGTTTDWVLQTQATGEATNCRHQDLCRGPCDWVTDVCTNRLTAQ